MAAILSKKKRIIRKPVVYLSTGILLIAAGCITFNYLDAIAAAIKSFSAILSVTCGILSARLERLAFR